MHPLRKLREAGPPTVEQGAALLEDVVFNSPLLVRPLEGRDVVARAIAQSAHSRDGVRDYVLEQKLDERTTFLRWKGTIDGRKLESLELLVDGPDGLLVERTIAYRPFPSVNIFRDQMRAGLDQEEFVTIPALPNAADWDAFEAAREALLPNLSRATPAERYKVQAHGVVAAAQHPGGTPGVTIAERPRPL